MKITQTFSILIWANKAKATNDGLPLFARITVDGKRAEISLKRKVDPNNWNAKAGCIDGKGEDAKATNNYITQIKSELLKIYNQMQMFDEFITAEVIKVRFTGEKVEKRTILQVFDYHNEQMERIVGIDVVPATLVKFKTIRTKLNLFIWYQYKKSDYYLEELSHQFVTNFEYYLKTVEHIQHNITMKYLVYFLKDTENAQKYNISFRKGILLSGPVGCGKTSLMSLLKFLLPAENRYVVKSCREVNFEFIQEGYTVIRKYSNHSFNKDVPKTYCFDDLGTEDNLKYYGNDCNAMAEILISRYDLFISRKMLTHLTSNLTGTEMEDYYGLRVRSRLREMFNLIAFDSNSKDKRC